MKKKLLILECLVFAIGTYVAVTGVQNSILIQNVLACEDDEDDCSGDHGSGGVGGGDACYKSIDERGSANLQCSSCRVVPYYMSDKGTC